MRTPLAKGIKTSKAKAIDRAGGDYEGGLIRGFAVVTRGEALGHGMWIDAAFLKQTADAINAESEGQKSRFTHPGLSSDGLGKFLGRTKNATVNGDVVHADQHFATSAHKTPDGDLAGYVMDRAEEDPASFGASISFLRDADAEDEFIIAQGGAIEYDRFGDRIVSGFTSPDQFNTNNLPHARLKELWAVDVVDDPAANPNGLFHRGQEIATEAESLAAYTLGLSSNRPDAVHLGIDPDRASQFIARFLDRHGLEIVPKHEELSMSDEDKPAEQPVVEPVVETPVEEKPTDTPIEQATEQPVETPTDQSAGKRFLEAFGAKGAVWFCEGKTFEEAQTQYNADLQTEIESLKKSHAELQAQLKVGRGEATPVSFQAEQTADQKATAKLKEKVGSDGLARFAAGITFKS